MPVDFVGRETNVLTLMTVLIFRLVLCTKYRNGYVNWIWILSCCKRCLEQSHQRTWTSIIHWKWENMSCYIVAVRVAIILFACQFLEAYSILAHSNEVPKWCQWPHGTICMGQLVTILVQTLAVVIFYVPLTKMGLYWFR